MYDFHRVFRETVIDYLDEGVYFTDLDMNILYWSKSAEAITGYTSDEAVGQKCSEILSHTDENGKPIPAKKSLVTETLNDGTHKEAFLFLLHKDEHSIPVTLRKFPVYSSTDQMTGYIGIIINNTDQKAGQARMNALTKAAYMDSLSEMFSKQYIESRLQALLAEPSITRKPFSILYINVKGFRDINEAYGVLRSDQLFKLVAQRLSSGVHSPNIIGRWHGASFIVVADTSNKSLLLLLMEKLKSLVSESGFPVGDEIISLNITIGYALAQNYDSVDYLIERASKNLLEEKMAQEESHPANPVNPVRAATTSSASSSSRPKSRFHSAKQKR